MVRVSADSKTRQDLGIMQEDISDGQTKQSWNKSETIQNYKASPLQRQIGNLTIP
jgi:hypothetical protein